ncbi:MAG: GIY-YIG nuclease family protein [Piscirickettsiaceae bacterium]|nr:GIY-YIG nuclease family protein [Piscirickettsiaceae bacterium]
MSKSDWFVYIIEAENGHFYTGITTDIKRRFSEHQSKQGGARFFHTSSAKKIVFQEPHPDRSSASKREAAIKKLSRQAKKELIAQQ